MSHNSEGGSSYPEPAIVLLIDEWWPAALWATLKLPFRWKLLLIGERERKADAPSLMPAAAWLVKEPSLPKWTDASVEGPPKRFAMRLLGYRRENKWHKTVIIQQRRDETHSSEPMWYTSMNVSLYSCTSDSDSDSGCVSEGAPVASLWTRSFSWLMKCVVSWGGCQWGLVMAKCIRDNSVFPSSACW